MKIAGPFSLRRNAVRCVNLAWSFYPPMRIQSLVVGCSVATFHPGEGQDMAVEGVVEVTDSNFDSDVLKSSEPVLVDFWAAWCGPCRALAPVVDEIATSYRGRLKVGKMDVDRNNATPQRYGVRGIPTLLLFKDGQVKEQIVGYVPKDQIAKAIDRHLNVVEMRPAATTAEKQAR
jgi:thioredoxin 1